MSIPIAVTIDVIGIKTRRMGGGGGGGIAWCSSCSGQRCL